MSGVRPPDVSTIGPNGYAGWIVAESLDRITQALVNEFVKSQNLEHLAGAEQFERFANYCVVSSEHSDTFDVEEISGPGDEVGIDGIAVVANGSLVTNPDEIVGLVDQNRYLEVTFVFVQAKRSPAFSEAAIGNFGFAVTDFFGDANLPRTDFIDRYLEIKEAIYENSPRFSRGLPRLHLYYVTSGRWDEPDVVLERIRREEEVLTTSGLFGSVRLGPIGAGELQALYLRTKNPIASEFTLGQRVTLPEITGVREAYLGVVPAAEYLRLIVDEGGQIRKGLFTDNVRDFQGDNEINRQIAETLNSDARERFAVLNNGVTIVARELRTTADKVYIEDYQIVNGGQTSHVLFQERDALTDRVFIPIKVISTEDEALTTAVITATNSQTPVKTEELNARAEFERRLERFFETYDGPRALHYERRSKQYSENTDIEKVRIITRQQLVRAFAAMFRDEPHRATGYVPGLMGQLGEQIFKDEHALDPYYASAFAHYKLEFFWRNQQLTAESKPGRWQILMAARHLAVGRQVGPLNSKEAIRNANKLSEVLWLEKDAVALFEEAIVVVARATSGTWERDHMRNEPTTQDVLRALP